MLENFSLEDKRLIPKSLLSKTSLQKEKTNCITQEVSLKIIVFFPSALEDNIGD